jgi:hypothetical protein
LFIGGAASRTTFYRKTKQKENKMERVDMGKVKDACEKYYTKLKQGSIKQEGDCNLWFRKKA